MKHVPDRRLCSVFALSLRCFRFVRFKFVVAAPIAMDQSSQEKEKPICDIVCSDQTRPVRCRGGRQRRRQKLALKPSIRRDDSSHLSAVVELSRRRRRR